MIVALGMMAALVLIVAVDTSWLTVARLRFYAPAIYSVGVHSVITQYISRYNLPLMGILFIELRFAVFFLWSRFSAVIIGLNSRN